MSKTIPLTQYIFRRLQQHGVDSVHGVPGDFTLRALDHLQAVGTKWVGSCNELNAGYAADGFARIRGLGALFTTYGVGELSAINAVAGSYAEDVPVLHIVGLPRSKYASTKYRNAKSIHEGKLVHHMLEVGNPRVFGKIHEHVTVDGAYLFDPDANERFDEVLKSCLHYHKPAYVALPSDMIDQPVPEVMLEGKLFQVNRVSAGPALISDLIDMISRAQRPLILVDKLAGTANFRDQVNQFVRKSGIPTLTMPSGAGTVDHDIPNYFGVHAGPVGQIDTMTYCANADLVIAINPMFSDTQTLGWQTVPRKQSLIHVRRNATTYFSARNKVTTHEMLNEDVIALLNEKIDSIKIHQPDASSLGNFRKIKPKVFDDLQEPIDQTSFYLRLNRYLRPHDIILLGNATPILGGRDFVLPRGCRVICSGLWFSIGHMLPAAQGAALAQQFDIRADGRKAGRTILIDGDGSFQTTVQELSTIIRLRLNVTIFIINNSGYAYERQIHGMDADYNNLAPWKYRDLPSVFGADETIRLAKESGEQYSVDTCVIRTWSDLDKLLEDEKYDNGLGGRGVPGLKLVEVIVDKYDIPEKFKTVFKTAGEALKYQKFRDSAEER